jgi:hypothetical protein
MWDEETQTYINTAPPDDINYGYSTSTDAPTELVAPVDLSGGAAPIVYGTVRSEPQGFPSTHSVAAAQNNSMADRGRGSELGASNVWAATGANILNAVAQTGINVYAQRNGVYTSALPQNTMSNASPQQLRQSNQAKNQGLLMLAAICGLVYVLAK